MTPEEFLRERIVEDAMLAEVFAGVDPKHYETSDVDTSPEYVTIYVAPDRWLTECEAKLRIVDRETGSVRLPVGGAAPPAPDQRLPARGEEASPEMRWWIETYCTRVTDTPTLRDLAVVYAGHPDYREEWRP